MKVFRNWCERRVDYGATVQLWVHLRCVLNGQKNGFFFPEKDL